MLQQINFRNRECYRHAKSARQRASECRDVQERREFLDMAERWLSKRVVTNSRSGVGNGSGGALKRAHP